MSEGNPNQTTMASLLAPSLFIMYNPSRKKQWINTELALVTDATTATDLYRFPF